MADVIRAHCDASGTLRSGLGVGATIARMLERLAICRTARLGGHLYACRSCGHQHPAYNSCRDRHCPKCQAHKRAEWLAERAKDLLPVRYFHVVFTIPDELNAVALANKRHVYDLLLRASADTLMDIAKDPKHLGADIGLLAVLHTWGQTLRHHPHVHCVVPGGGIGTDNKQWVRCRADFFLPVRVLSAVFRGKFLAGLKRLYERGDLRLEGRSTSLREPKAFADFLGARYEQPWVVYAKPPFGGPDVVLKYLARYTHRVAIANSRIVALDERGVTFRYKDYTHGGGQRLMTLPSEKFLRRFALHHLPKGFVRIRQYGFLANRARARNLTLCRQLIENVQAGETRLAAAPTLPVEVRRCTRCGSELVLVSPFDPQSSWEYQPPDPARLDTS